MKFSKAYNYLLLSLLAGFSAQPLQAQEIRPLTVDELFRLGIDNSLRIKASQLNKDIAGYNEKSARTERLPEISLGAAGTYIGQPIVYTKGLRHPEHPSMPDWGQSYEARLAQPLYQGGRIRQVITRASLERQIADLAMVRDKAEIKLMLMDKYLYLFELYKEKEVLNRNIEESRQRLHDIRQRRKEGMLTQNDVIRSELQLTNYELAFREAGNNITIVSQQLDIVLGLDEKLLLLPDTATLGMPVPLLSYEAYMNEASNNYPELRMARYSTDIARADVRIARANYFPILSFNASESLAKPITGSSPAKDMFMNTWNVSLALSYRLSSLYKNHHTLSASQGAVLMQQNGEEQLTQELRIEIRTAFIKHEEALDRVKALTLAVGQANENYRIVESKYLNQLSILTDLLDASSVRLDAELQLTSARTNVIYTYYQLLRATGKL